MNLHELREQLSKTRYTAVLALVMIVMIYIGFQLAQINRDYLLQQLGVAETTTQNLALENQRLITENNELSAKVEIAEFANEALDKRIREGLQRERDLSEQVAFYQNVVAPELSEDGFSINGIQASEAASEGYFNLSMVLIQQTRLKDTINGNLAVELYGSQDGKPARIDMGSLLEEEQQQALRYSFKYFQTVTLRFQMPAGFIPEGVSLTTTIYQYRKRRGDYSQSIEWSQISS